MHDDEHEIFCISAEEEGVRLDKVLADRFKSTQSRAYFQMLIEEQHVLLNGEPIKKRIRPRSGDEVQVNFVLTPEIALTAEAIPLEIIYEDDDILVVNKPAGMVVHPATGNWTGTFVNALLYHCQHVSALSALAAASLRPGIVHRLDKDTSGLLLAAKTGLAQQRLIEMFTQRKIHKEYVAICLGNPGNGEINAPIGRHPIQRQKMAVIEGGRNALSICHVLKCDGKISLVKIVLATGRTHQIRVHLQHRKTPVLGDSVYGNSQVNLKYGAARQLLHASLLRFTHPVNGNLLEFTAPLPDDMLNTLKKFE